MKLCECYNDCSLEHITGVLILITTLHLTKRNLNLSSYTDTKWQETEKNGVQQWTKIYLFVALKCKEMYPRVIMCCLSYYYCIKNLKTVYWLHQSWHKYTFKLKRQWKWLRETNILYYHFKYGNYCNFKSKLLATSQAMKIGYHTTPVYINFL